MFLPTSTTIPNGALVKTRHGNGVVVGHSKVAIGKNPFYDILLLCEDGSVKLWNVYHSSEENNQVFPVIDTNSEDWTTVELIDYCPINCMEIPASLRQYLLDKREGKVKAIGD